MGSLAQAIVASVEMLIRLGLIWLATEMLKQNPTVNDLARVIEVLFYSLVVSGLALIVIGAVTGSTVL